MGYHPVFEGVILGYRPVFDVIAPLQGDIKIRSKLSPSEKKIALKSGIFLIFLIKMSSKKRLIFYKSFVHFVFLFLSSVE